MKMDQRQVDQYLSLHIHMKRYQEQVEPLLLSHLLKKLLHQPKGHNFFENGTNNREGKEFFFK